MNLYFSPEILHLQPMKQLYILHGWAVEAHNTQKWDDFSSRLKEKGIKANILQIPGLDTDLSEPWNLSKYVEWLQKELPQEPVLLLGHSFGGQIAIRFTAENTNRVQQLLLVDSAGIIDNAVSKQIKRMFFYVLAKIGKLFTQSENLKKLLYKVAREQDYFKSDPIQKETMKSVIAEEILEDIPNITMPTLIIWGQNDMATPIKFAYVLHAGITQSELEIIPGARHAPQFTHTTEVVNLIANFLERKK